ncbi:hypothetical protein [Burkholderia stagnalis]|uniref:Uncharacterized protein n=1 Tax=Burkholderia stagnalis TaxID=1503054 RepID=A0A102WKM5_9BURK|nr:hypothetical protein [Burkholderia stagnalis]KVC52301.1 hypothetical protein WS59_33260 [Burkholderia stagnalis]KVN17481.1 hypothetical protein WT10_03465 [Burkholderia stagnalis]KVZ05920.1 hypothetical protein WT35_24320 [Burkholderia stagnalis]KWA50574.1 hypothetical protein WT43_29185 [Burkholderia stagnalis]KWA61704.1 hypothetical protein WT42_03000 [Burkholderia stagnalis]
MATAGRKRTVLTPGGQDAATQDDQGMQDRRETTVDDGPPLTRPSRSKYINQPASAVDPKEIVAAVLTKDGWVVPDLSAGRG